MSNENETYAEERARKQAMWEKARLDNFALRIGCALLPQYVRGTNFHFEGWAKKSRELAEALIKELG